MKNSSVFRSVTSFFALLTFGCHAPTVLRMEPNAQKADLRPINIGTNSSRVVLATANEPVKKKSKPRFDNYPLGDYKSEQGAVTVIFRDEYLIRVDGDSKLRAASSDVASSVNGVLKANGLLRV